MGVDPGAQGLQALISLGCGPALGLAYDFGMALARRSRRGWLRAVNSVWFALLSALTLYLLGSIAGRGQLRLFMLLGMALGGLLYFIALRRPGMLLAGWLAAGSLLCLRCLLFPLRLLRKMAENFRKITKNIFHYCCKWYKLQNEFTASAFLPFPSEAYDENSEIRYRDHYGAAVRNADGIRSGVPLQNEYAHRRSGKGKRRAGRRSAGAGGE